MDCQPGSPGLRLPMLAHSGVLQTLSSLTVAGAAPESSWNRLTGFPFNLLAWRPAGPETCCKVRILGISPWAGKQIHAVRAALASHGPVTKNNDVAPTKCKSLKMIRAKIGATLQLRQIFRPTAASSSPP